MPQAFLTVVRNAISSLSSSSSPFNLLQLRALQPRETTRTFSFHAFHPFRPVTRLRPDRKLAPCPPYPYGARHTYKEADAGLYGGAQLQSGNKISQGRNKGKTRRRWYPNVRLETIRSEALDKTLTIPITASCMRTIRKCGGLDQYLLGDKPARIKELGLFGWQLRWKVLKSPVMTRIHQTEREELGLSAQPPRLETFEKAWIRDAELREEVQKEQKKGWLEMKEKDERFKRHMQSGRRAKGKKYHSIRDVVPPFDVGAFEMFGWVAPEKKTYEKKAYEKRAYEKEASLQS